MAVEQPFMAAWLVRRQALGHDHRDEMWEGAQHAVPQVWVRHARVASQVLRVLGPLADERGLPDIGEFNPSDAQAWRANAASEVLGCSMAWLMEQIRWP